MDTVSAILLQHLYRVTLVKGTEGRAGIWQLCGTGGSINIAFTYLAELFIQHNTHF